MLRHIYMHITNFSLVTGKVNLILDVFWVWIA
jgi:hypothetical protein